MLTEPGQFNAGWGWAYHSVMAVIMHIRLGQGVMLVVGLLLAASLAAQETGSGSADLSTRPLRQRHLHLYLKAALRGLRRRHPDLPVPVLSLAAEVSHDQMPPVAEAADWYRLLRDASCGLNQGPEAFAQAQNDAVPQAVAMAAETPEIAWMHWLCHVDRQMRVVERVLTPVWLPSAFAPGIPIFQDGFMPATEALSQLREGGPALLPRWSSGGEPRWAHVPQWHLLGPVLDAGRPSWGSTELPDLVPNIHLRYRLNGQESASAWRLQRHDGVMLDNGGDATVVQRWYAWSDLRSPTAGFRWLRVQAPGSDWVLWLNGLQVAGACRDKGPDDMTVRLRLRAGDNQLLLAWQGLTPPALAVGIGGPIEAALRGTDAMTPLLSEDWQGWQEQGRGAVKAVFQDAARPPDVWDIDQGLHVAWRVDCAVTDLRPLLLGDSLVVVDEDAVIAVARADGRERWRWPVKAVRALAGAGRQVYVVCGEGRLHSLALGDGSSGWRHDLDPVPDGITLVAVEDRVVASMPTAGLSWAWAADDGRELWRHQGRAVPDIVEPVLWSLVAGDHPSHVLVNGRHLLSLGDGAAVDLPVPVTADNAAAIVAAPVVASIDRALRFDGDSTSVALWHDDRVAQGGPVATDGHLLIGVAPAAAFQEPAPFLPDPGRLEAPAANDVLIRPRDDAGASAQEAPLQLYLRNLFTGEMLYRDVRGTLWRPQGDGLRHPPLVVGSQLWLVDPGGAEGGGSITVIEDLGRRPQLRMVNRIPALHMGPIVDGDQVFLITDGQIIALGLPEGGVDRRSYRRRLEFLLQDLADMWSLPAPVIEPVAAADLPGPIPKWPLAHDTAPGNWLMAGPVPMAGLGPVLHPAAEPLVQLPRLGGLAEEAVASSRWRWCRAMTEVAVQRRFVESLYFTARFSEQLRLPYRSLVDPTSASVTWLATVIVCDRPRVMELSLSGADAAWISGQALKDGDRFHLRPGLYPVVIRIQTRQMPATVADRALFNVVVRDVQQTNRSHAQWIERARLLRHRLDALLNEAPELLTDVRLERVLIALDEVDGFAGE